MAPTGFAAVRSNGMGRVRARLLTALHEEHGLRELFCLEEPPTHQHPDALSVTLC